MPDKKKKPFDRMIAVIVPLKVYPLTVVFSFNQTDAKLRNTLKKLGLKDPDADGAKYKYESGAGRYVFYMEGNNLGLIRMKTIPDTPYNMAIMCHEVNHIVNLVMWYIGMPLQTGVSDEAYAYLTSYLIEEVLEQIKEYIFK